MASSPCVLTRSSLCVSLCPDPLFLQGHQSERINVHPKVSSLKSLHMTELQSLLSHRARFTVLSPVTIPSMFLPQQFPTPCPVFPASPSPVQTPGLHVKGFVWSGPYSLVRVSAGVASDDYDIPLWDTTMNIHVFSETYEMAVSLCCSEPAQLMSRVSLKGLRLLHLTSGITSPRSLPCYRVGVPALPPLPPPHPDLTLLVRVCVVPRVEPSVFGTCYPTNMWPILVAQGTFRSTNCM